MDNADRAERARRALETYKATKHEAEYSGEPDSLALRDLLTDVMHLCRQDGYDFDRELSFATDHFGAEELGHE